MPRFFISNEQIEDGKLTLAGDDAHHISRSLRMAAGEHITVCDTEGNEYECVLEDFLDGRVTASVISQGKSLSEPPFKARLYQALPKGEKLDMIIQKSVECGVFSITTFISERCIAKEGSNEEKKLQRRARISLEAAKQSGRGAVPEIFPTVSFKQAVKEAAEADIALFCYEGAQTAPLRELLQAKKQEYYSNASGKRPEISVMIGSEGGFSPAEAEYARESGLNLVGLGKRILRTETASLFMLSALVYELEL